MNTAFDSVFDGAKSSAIGRRVEAKKSIVDQIGALKKASVAGDRVKIRAAILAALSALSSVDDDESAEVDEAMDFIRRVGEGKEDSTDKHKVFYLGRRVYDTCNSIMAHIEGSIHKQRLVNRAITRCAILDGRAR